MIDRLRVFPRRTKATPTDDSVRIGQPGLWDREAKRIDISVVFTWDLPEAERIAKFWSKYGPTNIGGPATGKMGGEFCSGEYLKEGYTITSRGCPEKCWFCSAWKRDGDKVRELPIVNGWNVQDDNLLACSEKHIRSVFNMLEQQIQRVEFTGGLQPHRFRSWHVDLLLKLKPRPVVWFAYDDADDFDAMKTACAMLREAGWYRQCMRVYVLCGYKGDSFEDAEHRLKRVVSCGADPMAMVFRDPDGKEPYGWHSWARYWIRPALRQGKGHPLAKLKSPQEKLPFK